MFDRLVAPDGSAKGIALLGIVSGHLLADRGPAKLLEGKQYGGTVEQIVQKVRAIARLAEPLGRCAIEDDLGMAARGIKGLDHVARDPLPGEIDENEARAGAFAGEHDGMGGDVAIGDGDLPAGELAAIETHAKPCRIRLARAFGYGERADHFARGDFRQDGGLLGLAARHLHGFGQQIGR